MKLKLLVSVVTVKADADNQFEELIPEVQLAAEVGVVDRTVREWRERATGQTTSGLVAQYSIAGQLLPSGLKAGRLDIELRDPRLHAQI